MVKQIEDDKDQCDYIKLSALGSLKLKFEKLIEIKFIHSKANDFP